MNTNQQHSTQQLVFADNDLVESTSSTSGEERKPAKDLQVSYSIDNNRGAIRVTRSDGAYLLFQGDDAVKIQKELDIASSTDPDYEVLFAPYFKREVVAEISHSWKEPERLAFVLIQEGGASDELYLHSHTSREAAEDDRVSCADSGYRTSDIFEIPAALANHPGFYEVVEGLLRANLEYPTADEE